MSRAETLAGLTEAIAGHQYVTPESEDEYGMHNYACQCGEPMHECYEDDAWAKHAAHVAAVALAWLEGHGWAETVTGSQPIRTYYSSYTPDGKLWCQTRDPEEVRERSKGKDCTFERYDVYERGVTSAWVPVETGEDA